MMGFAIMSYKSNGIGGFLSIGFGTSMLQFTNIVKKPIIWMPTILASALVGPFATTLFPLTNVKEGAGMGSSGLVGQIGTFAAMNGSEPWSTTLLKVVGLQFILPMLLVWLLHYFFLKKGWYTNDDLKLNTNL